MSELPKPVREQAGRIGNRARVPLGVPIKDITFQDLIHVGPQSKVFRVRNENMAGVLLLSIERVNILL